MTKPAASSTRDLERAYLEDVATKLGSADSTAFLLSLQQGELDKLRARARGHRNRPGFLGKAMDWCIPVAITVTLVAFLGAALGANPMNSALGAKLFGASRMAFPIALFATVAAVSVLVCLAAFESWRSLSNDALRSIETHTESLDGDTESIFFCVLACARSARCEDYRCQVEALGREFITADLIAMTELYSQDYPEHKDEDDEDGDANTTLLEKHGIDLLRRPQVPAASSRA